VSTLLLTSDASVTYIRRVVKNNSRRQQHENDRNEPERPATSLKSHDIHQRQNCYVKND